MSFVTRFAKAIFILRAHGPIELARAALRFVRGRSAPSILDECELVYQALDASRTRGTMVDVGAHFGTSLLPFATSGWRVLALEPDARNRARLETTVLGIANVTIDTRAASDHTEADVQFFRSDVSTGISGLSAFDPSHFEADRVQLTTLDEILSDHGITAIDFLKIDTEGFDLMVLKGLPWKRIRPKVIVCEFEDAKSIPLGYTYDALACFLSDHGYSVLISEWRPIVKYGVAHSWARMVEYPSALLEPRAWGNFVASSDKELLSRLRTLFQRAALDQPSRHQYRMVHKVSPPSTA